jgi:hypothetical protein
LIILRNPLRYNSSSLWDDGGGGSLRIAAGEVLRERLELRGVCLLPFQIMSRNEQHDAGKNQRD